MDNVNVPCYRFKTIDFNHGLYDSFVDMTYVLLMENSEREKHVYEQINKFQPTKKVKIQYNKGYKKCRKTLCEQRANWDLFDANYNVILDAYQNNYNNILILEDDFVINEDLIYNKDTVNEIHEFINSNDVDLYLLGIITPKFNFDNKHQQCPDLFNIPCGGTQGYIMNYNGMSKFLNYYEKLNCNVLSELSDNGHIDWFYSTSFNTYTYHKPLIVQPLEMTENRKNNWDNPLKNLYIRCFNLDAKNDKELVKSYEILYKTVKIITYGILFSVITFIILLLYKFGYCK
tara:strand:+ start:384 stop:1247 length:864 start_codon:yes stop_codon:yes gene_type:complete